MPEKRHGTQAGKEDGMQITSSYGVEIRKVGSPVSLTYRVYRERCVSSRCSMTPSGRNSP